MSIKDLIKLHDIDRVLLDRSLAIVKDFIIARKLILYGGQAIDYALRIKGSKIYEDTELPDFDMYSVNHVKDAYDLADILNTQGFPRITAIRALHIQTMKVRTDFIPCADISYLPQDVYDKLPTINYNNMRVVHPDYQRIDMHMNFAYPFNNAPHEDIFRWEKNIKRFNMFEKYWPLMIEPSIKPVMHELEIKEDLSDVIFSGFAHYGFLAAEYKLITGDDKYSDIQFDGQTLVCPKFHEHINIFIYDFLSIKGEKHYRPIIDVIPESKIVGCIRYYKIANKVLSIYKHDNMYFTSIQYLMAWFMFHATFVNERYKEYYYNLLNMINVVENKLKSQMKEWFKSPFAPTVVHINRLNIEASTAISLYMQHDKIGGELPEFVRPYLNDRSIMDDLPKNYYLDSNKGRPDDSIPKNAEFKRDGGLIS